MERFVSVCREAEGVELTVTSMLIISPSSSCRLTTNSWEQVNICGNDKMCGEQWWKKVNLCTCQVCRDKPHCWPTYRQTWGTPRTAEERGTHCDGWPPGERWSLSHLSSCQPGGERSNMIGHNPDNSQAVETVTHTQYLQTAASEQKYVSG